MTDKDMKPAFTGKPAADMEALVEELEECIGLDNNYNGTGISVAVFNETEATAKVAAFIEAQKPEVSEDVVQFCYELEQFATVDCGTFRREKAISMIAALCKKREAEKLRLRDDLLLEQTGEQAKLRADNEQLREALEFYHAESGNWSKKDGCVWDGVNKDTGQIAQAALERP